jgi:hypothetical protein
MDDDDDDDDHDNFQLLSGRRLAGSGSRSAADFRDLIEPLTK